MKIGESACAQISLAQKPSSIPFLSLPKVITLRPARFAFPCDSETSLRSKVTVNPMDRSMTGMTGLTPKIPKYPAMSEVATVVLRRTPFPSCVCAAEPGEGFT